jgi:hypothetical protein
MTGARRIKLGFEFRLLARLKHACANDAFGVHENVGTAVVGLNKSEAAILIVHLNNSSRHSFSSGWVKWLDPYRETARMVLEPWLIETALGSLGRRLNPAEQQTIVKATRTPHKVKWPDWWSEHP